MLALQQTLTEVFGGVAYAQMSVASSTEIVTGVVSDISDTLSGGLPVLFTLVGILIGLFFVIRQVRKWIGRGK